MERGRVACIDPTVAGRFEMEATGTRCDPDLLRRPMAVDDDLAAVIELDFEYAVRRGLELQPGVLDGRLDVRQRGVRRPAEFDFRHDVPC